MRRWKSDSRRVSWNGGIRTRRAIRAWGPVVGTRYVDRLSILRGAPSLAELFNVQSLRFHQLTGDRSGQYAVSLTGQVRLIVTIANETTLQVEEVVDYHG